MTQVNPEQNHADTCSCDTCIQSRFRSKTAWASLFALIGLLLGTFGVTCPNSHIHLLRDLFFAALVPEF